MTVNEQLNTIIIAKCGRLSNQQIAQQSSRLPASQALKKKCGVFFSEAVLNFPQ
jgi:hypothetical protein